MSEAVGLKELLRRKIDQMKGADEFSHESMVDYLDQRMKQHRQAVETAGLSRLSSTDLHVPGAKDDKAKPIAGELVLGFPRALEALVAVATYGANKYSRGGYLHVNNFDVRYLDAAMRHLLSYGRGDKTDKESGLPHLAHCLWNIAAILEMETRHEESSGS